MSAFSPGQEEAIRRIAGEVCSEMIKELNVRTSTFEADDLSAESVNRMVDEVATSIFKHRRS